MHLQLVDNRTVVALHEVKATVVEGNIAKTKKESVVVILSRSGTSSVRISCWVSSALVEHWVLNPSSRTAEMSIMDWTTSKARRISCSASSLSAIPRHDDGRLFPCPRTWLLFHRHNYARVGALSAAAISLALRVTKPLINIDNHLGRLSVTSIGTRQSGISARLFQQLCRVLKVIFFGLIIRLYITHFVKFEIHLLQLVGVQVSLTGLYRLGLSGIVSKCRFINLIIIRECEIVSWHSLCNVKLFIEISCEGARY